MMGRDNNWREEEFTGGMERAFKELNPSDKQQEDLWNSIEIQVSTKKKISIFNMGYTFRRVITAAVLCMVILIVGTGVNAATEGKIVYSIKKVLGFETNRIKESSEQNRNDILKSTLFISEINAYVPDLSYCDDKVVVFANLRGMVIYDREKAQVASVLDLQEINCNYLYGDDDSEIMTRILPQKNSLVIFNETKGEGVEKTYYECNYSKLSEINVMVKQATEDKGKDLVAQWKKYRKDYFMDTFDLIQEIKEVEQAVLYSDNCFLWKDSFESEKQSYLIMNNNSEDKRQRVYYLKTRDVKSGEIKKEKLNIQIEEEGQEEVQPKFQYTGNDKEVAAICEYLLSEDQDVIYWDLENKDKYINFIIPIIYGKAEKGDKIYVFGNFWHEKCHINGNVLENYGGGSLPARITLKKVGEDDYKVIEVIRAGDGEMYRESIQEMTKDYPEMEEKYYDDNEDKKRQKLQKKFFRMYIENNNLDIKYYSEAGWGKKSIY